MPLVEDSVVILRGFIYPHIALVAKHVYRIFLWMISKEIYIFEVFSVQGFLELD